MYGDSHRTEFPGASDRIKLLRTEVTKMSLGGLYLAPNASTLRLQHLYILLTTLYEQICTVILTVLESLAGVIRKGVLRTDVTKQILV